LQTTIVYRVKMGVLSISMAEEDDKKQEIIDVQPKKIGPDPLTICPVNPLDFRRENGEWKLDPGWWRKPRGVKK